MAITHTITRKWSSGGATLSKNEAVSGDGESNIDAELPVADADFLINFSLQFAGLKSFYMVCNQDAVVTPYDTGDTPMDPIVLTANVPFVWTDGSGLANPFNADVSALHVSNVAATAPTLQIRSLSDATPNAS